MKINEVFVSIQGEGPDAGRRCVFVRTGGCSARCNFCDTKYAWDTYIETSVDEILNTVERIGIPYVVITGGEPTEQMEELEKLAIGLKNMDYYVALETNGTDPSLQEDLFDKVIVSPKYIDDWDKWINRDVYLKFVVSELNVGSVMGWAKQNNIQDIYYMPEGKDVETLMRNTAVILDALQHFDVQGYICTRLQYILRVK